MEALDDAMRELKQFMHSGRFDMIKNPRNLVP